jgi:prohibitin 1
MNKLGSFATFFGIGLVTLNSAVYTVDPGEKALIMDKIKGLKQQVYSQGYHLLIPGIQVFFVIIVRVLLSMTVV